MWLRSIAIHRTADRHEGYVAHEDQGIVIPKGGLDKGRQSLEIGIGSS